ncbi:MAG: hypothetical protein WBX05_06075 [Pseudolabrys sp.]
MADVSDDLAAKIDERRRKLDQVDQAIAEIRRLQHEREAVAIAPGRSAGAGDAKRQLEIAPLLRPPTERDPAAPTTPQRHRQRIGGADPAIRAANKRRASQAASRSGRA